MDDTPATLLTLPTELLTLIVAALAQPEAVALTVVHPLLRKAVIDALRVLSVSRTLCAYIVHNRIPLTATHDLTLPEQLPRKHLAALLRNCPALTSLCVRNDMAPAAVELLRAPASLLRLDVSHAKLTRAALRATLEASPNLEHLAVSDCGLRCADVVDIVDALCPRLSSLEIERLDGAPCLPPGLASRVTHFACRVQHSDSGALAALVRLRELLLQVDSEMPLNSLAHPERLEVLHARGARLALGVLSPLVNLRELDVTGVELLNSATSAPLPPFEHLAKLCCAGTKLADSLLLCAMPSLRVLEAADTPMGPFAAFLQTHPDMTALTLHPATLTAPAVRPTLSAASAAAIGTMHRLESLALAGVRCSDTFVAQALLPLVPHRRLRTLALLETDVVVDDLAAFARAARSLERLVLRPASAATLRDVGRASHARVAWR